MTDQEKLNEAWDEFKHDLIEALKPYIEPILDWLSKYFK